jgi:hypothetical protein
MMSAVFWAVLLAPLVVAVAVTMGQSTEIVDALLPVLASRDHDSRACQTR